MSSSCSLLNENPQNKESLTKKCYALETLERYSGCSASDFCSKILFTNFPRYVEHFAKSRDLTVHEGLMYKVAHSKKDDISILDIRIGSPSAALAIDLCSYLPLKYSIHLGMCAGLRKKYRVGDYLVPIGSIRDEGTSNHYFPLEMPALGNFLIQRVIANMLSEMCLRFHVGITHTSNIRFWEFDDAFKEKLIKYKAQGYELECATLFTSAYKRKLKLGALLLISDLPLMREGIKTKSKANQVYENFMDEHIELGVKMLKSIDSFKMLKQEHFNLTT